MPNHDQPSPWAPPAASTADPFAVSPPVHQTSPYGPTGYGPAGYGPVGPATSFYARPPIEVMMVPPRPGGRGLAIAGVVLGGLALLGVLLIGFFFVGFALLGLADDPGGGGGGYGPLRGTIAPASGSTVSGAALAEEVTKKVSDDGGEPAGVVCPATAKVAQDVTTVCHGTDYGEDSAFVVFFEDDQGHYTLLEV